jgi:hypothetical protein
VLKVLNIHITIDALIITDDTKTSGAQPFGLAASLISLASAFLFQ